MNNILNYTKKELEDYLEAVGEKKFKATQIFEWVYKKRVFDFSGFNNVKKEFIEFLKEKFVFSWIEIVKVEEDKTASKFLFKLSDNEFVEAVLMRHPYGLSLCISSQVGCNMGCLFCESGKLKRVRNLEVFEMVEQILLIENYINEKIKSIVIMGIGEPFDNYENIIKLLYIINEGKGLDIGARHITVSTCGLVPRILDFANIPLQVNLAISLHAATDEVRNKIMPINKVYKIKELIDAIKVYLSKTRRRVTIEYVMLKAVNDQEIDALKLTELLKNLNVYVNLIPYNETSGNFSSSDEQTFSKFSNILKSKGIDVTIRKRMGESISAACGQLRSKEVK